MLIFGARRSLGMRESRVADQRVIWRRNPDSWLDLMSMLPRSLRRVLRAMFLVLYRQTVGGCWQGGETQWLLIERSFTDLPANRAAPQ